MDKSVHGKCVSVILDSLAELLGTCGWPAEKANLRNSGKHSLAVCQESSFPKTCDRCASHVHPLPIAASVHTFPCVPCPLPSVHDCNVWGIRSLDNDKQASLCSLQPFRVCSCNNMTFIESFGIFLRSTRYRFDIIPFLFWQAVIDGQTGGTGRILDHISRHFT